MEGRGTRLKQNEGHNRPSLRQTRISRGIYQERVQYHSYAPSTHYFPWQPILQYIYNSATTSVVTFDTCRKLVMDIPSKATIVASTNPLHTLSRLLYRSNQRGFLELDLVLKKWVDDNIHSLDEILIKALVHVLDMVYVVYMGSKSGEIPDDNLKENHQILASVHSGWSEL
ncbi:hypothetical protein JHK87_007009 [Glycine soja]|nr:hypothetical protein JHK87_007009 [Glycine soja]